MGPVDGARLGVAVAKCDQAEVAICDLSSAAQGHSRALSCAKKATAREEGCPFAIGSTLAEWSAPQTKRGHAYREEPATCNAASLRGPAGNRYDLAGLCKRLSENRRATWEAKVGA